MFNTVDFRKSANSEHFKIFEFLNMLDLRTPTPMTATLGEQFF